MSKFTKKEFLENLKNDKLKNFTIVNHIGTESTKRFELLNKNKKEILTFSEKMIAIKLSNLLKHYNIEDSFISEQDVFNYIRTVDVVTDNITQSPGFKFENDISYYNYIVETPIQKEIKNILKEREQEEYENCFNFSRYPAINFTLDQLLNVNSENNKTTVDIKKHFLNWLAFSLQFKEKSGMAYVFISSTHGSGKGTISSVLQEFFSNLYMAEINNDTLTQQFNGILHNKRFILINELKIAFKDFEQVSSKLKTMVTDKTLTLRQMRVDQLNVDSCYNVLITSNDKVPMKIEPSDRRFCVIHNSTVPLAKAAKDELGLDGQDFIEAVKNEQFQFLQDLMNLKVNRKEAMYNSFNNNAKRYIVTNTNTQINNLSSLIDNNDIEGLIEHFYDVSTSANFERFLDEVNCGFLSNEIVNGFLSDNFREQDISKINKKSFFDKKFGESRKINYKTKSGTTKQARVRILANFDQKKLEDYLNTNTLPFENDEVCENDKKNKIVNRLKNKFNIKQEKNFENYEEKEKKKEDFDIDDMINELGNEDLESMFE